MAEAADKAPVRYRIADIEIDTGSRRVMRDGETLAFGALTFDFLVTLAESAPSLVSYQQLAERVWKGRSVTPETIAQRAKMLRDALSDDAKSPRYFELVRGQGYRLVVPVTDEENTKQKNPAIHKLWIVAVVALLGLAAFFGARTYLGGGSPKSVAVLPFADLSPNTDQQFLADGVAEELIGELSRLEGLDVASRTESFVFRGPRDLREVGRRLRVEAVLEGSLRKANDQLRITVQLIEVETGYHLWSENFSGDVGDIFSFQEEIAKSVVSALGVKLGVGGVNAFLGAGTTNYAAYEAFLRDEFARAVELDPNYAEAWARRAVRVAGTMHTSPPEEAPAIVARAYEYAEKALHLGRDSAYVNAQFATMIYTTWDWQRAERAFREALALKRDALNLDSYANMLMRTGRTREAMDTYEEQLALPRPTTMGLLYTDAALALGRFDDARDVLATVRSKRAPLTRLMLALNEGSDEAIKAALRDMPKRGVAYHAFFRPLVDVIDSPAASLELIRSVVADPDAAWPSRYREAAVVAAYFGEAELAFDILQKEVRFTPVRFGSLWYPMMADVRKLPQFKQFVIDVNLVDYWRSHGWSDYCRPIGNDDFVCE